MAGRNKIYGLIGRDIGYSFSPGYFADKFTKNAIADCEYRIFDLAVINDFTKLLASGLNLAGLNVTIPYKEAILPYLNNLDTVAAAIGAVNTIKFNADGSLTGYNTDYYGFQKSLEPLLKPNHTKALILGTGGASKAIAYVLSKLGISYQYISRKAGNGYISYKEVNDDMMREYNIIINTTPVGTFPDIEACPPLHYDGFTENHIALDLIYNPEQTRFLKRAAQNGAVVKNGYEMLILQAEKAWEIWNK